MLHFCSTFHCKIYKGNQKNIQKPYFVKIPGIWGPGVFGCLGKLPNMKGRDCYLVPRLPNHVSWLRLGVVFKLAEASKHLLVARGKKLLSLFDWKIWTMAKPRLWRFGDVANLYDREEPLSTSEWTASLPISENIPPNPAPQFKPARVRALERHRRRRAPAGTERQRLSKSSQVKNGCCCSRDLQHPSLEWWDDSSPLRYCHQRIGVDRSRQQRRYHQLGQARLPGRHPNVPTVANPHSALPSVVNFMNDNAQLIALFWDRARDLEAVPDRGAYWGRLSPLPGCFRGKWRFIDFDRDPRA